MYYICDLRDDWKRQKYVTFWRPANANYAWPLEWSGEYTPETIDGRGGYYFDDEASERERFPVPVAMAKLLAKPAVIDGKEVHCVPNTKKNRVLLRASAYVQRVPDLQKSAA